MEKMTVLKITINQLIKNENEIFNYEEKEI